MNVVPLRHDRLRLERFGRLVKEGKRRELRTLFARRGWYDENGIRQGGLVAFVRHFWHVLEPETPFMDGWPLWAMCLPYHAKITTEDGERHIGEIVESGWNGNILSYNHKTSRLEWKPIVARMKSPGQPLLRIETSRSGVLQLTRNHPVYVLGRGYVRADQVTAGDRVHLHSLPEGLSGPAEREPVLRSAMLLGSPIRGCARSAHAQLQALWKAVLSASIASNRRLLFNAVLGGLEDGSREHDLSAMWRKENLESYPAVSRLLGGVQEKRTPFQLRPLWNGGLSEALAGKTATVAKIWKGLRQFLQLAVRGEGKSRQKQSFLCQWEACKSVSAGILDGAAQNFRARGKSLLSLLGGAEEVGCASYRSGYDEQRGLESRRALPQVSLPAARSFDEGSQSAGGEGVSAAIVTAIVREAWIPDAVYNVEVLDNNNYFAEKILVHNCEHLEAVTFGEIRKLLINVPPGFMKSLLVDVFWPAWEWGPINKAHLRYVTFSYSAGLTERDNGKFGDLLTDSEYQSLYGERVRLVARGKPGVTKVHNSKKGWKLASSVGGVGTGERGDRIILDDPHNVKETESEIVRTETVRWFRESMSDRLNSIVTGVIVVIMQRVHADDVSGCIIENGFPYCHLMIPIEYDWKRQTIENEAGQVVPLATTIGWFDPRFDEADPDDEAGAGAWDDRFPFDARRELAFEKGPYAWAGQYQQSPNPRGGGLFKRLWWQLWDPPDGRFPSFDYLVASLDSAFTEKEENDPSALTIWGVFTNDEGQRRIMLVHAWRKHLQFSASRAKLVPFPDGNRFLWTGTAWRENRTWTEWRKRTMEHWGLIEWVDDTCTRFKINKLLIEAKASGISAGQELVNRYGQKDWSIQLEPVVGDKYARAVAVQPTFSQMLVYAPARDWSELVIDEMEVFPRHKYRDFTDSTSQAIKHLRAMGLAQTDEESHAAELETVMHRPQKKAIYPV